MRPILKNFPISDLALGVFLLECMRTVEEGLKIAKEMMEMSRHTCGICVTRHDEIWTCELCGKRCCADHITNQKIAEDDFMHVCTECCEDKFDRRA